MSYTIYVEREKLVALLEGREQKILLSEGRPTNRDLSGTEDIHLKLSHSWFRSFSQLKEDD